MKRLRLLINMVASRLVADKSVEAQAIDKAVFRSFGRILRTLRFRGALELGEQWTIDLAYLFLEAIVRTPYGMSLQFHAPLIASISLTNSCGANCRLCYADSTPRQTEIADHVISALAQSRIPIFLITGGEPLEHKNFHAIISEFLSRNKSLIICTSGLSNGLTDLIVSHPNKLTVLLTIWGDRANHDVIRGRGSFKKTLRRFDLLAKLPVSLSVNCVISEPSLSCLDGLLDMLGTRPHRASKIFLTRHIHVGRVDSSRLSINEPLLERIAGRRREVASRLKQPIIWSLPEPDPELLTHWTTWSANYLMRLLGMPLPRSCSAGNWALHVDESGYITPCFATKRQNISTRLFLDNFAMKWKQMQQDVSASPRSGYCRAEEHEQYVQIGLPVPSVETFADDGHV